ncbi:BnaA08g02880D [Brassica napus]|uniref:BnaA08g02880D protein n=1 Tax=Brassica napus TaxID=3708 RepID=A0A078FU34_BRANA|nr:BnaA08g02880D [Brassica napus]
MALCTYCLYLTSVYWRHWVIQHLHIRYKRFKSLFADICIHVLQTERERWLGFAWRNSAQHNRDRGTIRRHCLFPFISYTACLYAFRVPLSSFSILWPSCVPCQKQRYLCKCIL